jgi:hypothetical protein
MIVNERYEGGLDLFDGTSEIKIFGVWKLDEIRESDSTYNVDIHGECSLNDGEIEGDIKHTNVSVKCQSLYRVENPNDRWCLARSILLGLKYMEEGQHPTPEFKSYHLFQFLDDRREQAAALLKNSGIDLGKIRYGLCDAEMIQNWINKSYGPNFIRIVIFSSEISIKIIWKGCDTPSRYNLCLFHHNNHFSFIGEPKQLYKVINIF